MKFIWGLMRCHIAGSGVLVAPLPFGFSRPLPLYRRGRFFFTGIALFVLFQYSQNVNSWITRFFETNVNLLRVRYWFDGTSVSKLNVFPLNLIFETTNSSPSLISNTLQRNPFPVLLISIRTLESPSTHLPINQSFFVCFIIIYFPHRGGGGIDRSSL